MTIRVKLFAVLRESSGVAEVSLELADGASVAAAMGELAARYPRVAPLLPRAAAAVNMERAAADAVLQHGDELALLPPVSGGCA